MTQHEDHRGIFQIIPVPANGLFYTIQINRSSQTQSESPGQLYGAEDLRPGKDVNRRAKCLLLFRVDGTVKIVGGCDQKPPGFRMRPTSLKYAPKRGIHFDLVPSQQPQSAPQSLAERLVAWGPRGGGGRCWNGSQERPSVDGAPGSANPPRGAKWIPPIAPISAPCSMALMQAIASNCRSRKRVWVISPFS